MPVFIGITRLKNFVLKKGLVRLPEIPFVFLFGLKQVMAGKHLKNKSFH